MSNAKTRTHLYRHTDFNHCFLWALSLCLLLIYNLATTMSLLIGAIRPLLIQIVVAATESSDIHKMTREVKECTSLECPLFLGAACTCTRGAPTCAFMMECFGWGKTSNRWLCSIHYWRDHNRVEWKHRRCASCRGVACECVGTHARDVQRRGPHRLCGRTRMRTTPGARALAARQQAAGMCGRRGGG